MALFYGTCIIMISFALRASPLPLKNSIADQPSDDASDDFQRLTSLYYARRYGNNAESMESSASNYYASDYSSVTTPPSPAVVEEFEFEKIKPSEKVNHTLNIGDGLESQNQQEIKANLSQKFPDLLFSSPSATVTSNGPSGPFKAIICHDCDNSEGRNVGHSVSFSAIRSWNVGSSSSSSMSSSSNPPPSAMPEANHTEASVNFNNHRDNHEENQQIEMNDKVELLKVENKTERPNWNYPILPLNNNQNAQPASNPKKPIFNDLLKVPYDVLNAPLTEPPAAEPVQGTQIHINHQQKFNDTITSNYQHFQQFIHKNLNQKPPAVMQYYQSTQMPEQNYEVDESVSLMTNGRAHGVQSTTQRIEENVKNVDLPSSSVPHTSEQDQDAKFGYIVEGRNYRKYRVEEKTADGFIVGEYGLLSNNDGSPIQGVRYTADSNINPRLIYDALLKFLSL